MIHQEIETKRSESESAVRASLKLPGYGAKQIIELANIVYLEGDGNYATFHLASGGRLVMAYTLAHYDRLPGFWRIHKRFLVNGFFIARIDTQDAANAWVHLVNGIRLPIARRRVHEVRSAFYKNRPLLV